jgi:hypothetical protein
MEGRRNEGKINERREEKNTLESNPLIFLIYMLMFPQLLSQESINQSKQLLSIKHAACPCMWERLYSTVGCSPYGMVV